MFFLMSVSLLRRRKLAFFYSINAVLYSAGVLNFTSSGFVPSFDEICHVSFCQKFDGFTSIPEWLYTNWHRLEERINHFYGLTDQFSALLIAFSLTARISSSVFPLMGWLINNFFTLYPLFLKKLHKIHIISMRCT